MIATADLGRRLPDALTVLLCAAVLAAIVPSWPLGGWWLGSALLAYCALLRRWPDGWLLLVPAALPVLDLAPWTGRFFLDEFDALLAATVLMRTLRRGPRAHGLALAGAAPAWLALFCASSALALAIGAWPFPAPGLNGLNHYYSPYNGARLAKGLAWALLLWPQMRDALATDVVKTQRHFALGMGLGVLGAALAVVWERAAFTGLFNFDSGYRVVGLFSAMHAGGAYIEAYFALALPFLAWWTLGSRRWRERLAGATMLALGSYALLVTYARAGYLAAALAMLALALAPRLRRRRMRPRHALRAAALCAVVAVLAWVVLEGNAMQRRYASSARDLAVRAAHWQDGWRMMDRTPAALLAGMGLGRYPATYFMRSGEGVSPSYLALQNEGGNTFLAIAAGSPQYFEQLVGLEPNRRYQFSFNARSADPNARLGLPLCQKWLLYSRRCVGRSVLVGDTGGAWRNFAGSFTTRAPGPGPVLVPRPLKLSLFAQSEGSRIDVDDLSLRGADGRELLRNGSLGAGTDFWFFSGDNHLPWHLEHTWLQIGFEQGALGLAGFTALVVCAVVALWRRLRAGDPFAPVLAAALTAFLALSLLNSLFDFPRITMIVYLILLCALYDDIKSMPKRIV